MKKIMSILLVLMMVLSFAPMALAEDEETVEPVLVSEETEDETEVEVEAMSTLTGAEMRLLQLERAIERNMVRGNAVIEEAGDADTSELEGIMAELEALNAEVQAVDPAAEDAVQQFVDLKADAIGLSKQFRDGARESLGPGKSAQVKEKIKNKENARVKELAGKINQKKQMFNSERVQAMFEKLGIENEELVGQIKEGEAALKQAQDQIRDRIKEMTPEEKKEAFSGLKEAGVKRAVAAKVKMDKIKAKSLDREQERLQNRLEKIERNAGEGKSSEALRNYINNRLRVNEAAQERTQERLETANNIKANEKNSDEEADTDEGTDDTGSEGAGSDSGTGAGQGGSS